MFSKINSHFFTHFRSIPNIIFICIGFVIVINAQENYRAECVIISSVGADDVDSRESSSGINNYRVTTGDRSDDNLDDAWLYPGSYLGGIIGEGKPIRVIDINDSGVVVGYCYYNNNDGGYHFKPCKWSQGGSPFATALPLPEGYLDGFAYGINDNGSIVGKGDTSIFPSPNSRAFYQPLGRGMTLIAANGSEAKSINNSEVVVGNVEGRAFIWDSTNGLRFLDAVIGARDWNFTESVKINNTGQIVGYGFFQGEEKAFFWDGTQVYPIGNKSEFIIYGLNNVGQVVGSRTSQNDYGRTAFVWNKDSGFQNLSLDNGWLLTRAKDINDRGAIIADGYYRDSSNQRGLQRAWILTPKKLKPLIFVPGVGGSILKDKTKPDTDIEWINPNDLLLRVSAKDLSPLSLNPANTNNNIIAPDVLRYT